MMKAVAAAINRPIVPAGQGFPEGSTIPGIKKMMYSWSIRGVPRMTHMTVRVSQRRGVKRLIEPKETTRPRGSAPNSVTANRARVWTNPSFRAPTTVINKIIHSSKVVYHRKAGADVSSAPVGSNMFFTSAQ